MPPRDHHLGTFEKTMTMRTPNHPKATTDAPSRVLTRFCKRALLSSCFVASLTACSGGGAQGPYMGAGGGFMAEKAPPVDIVMFAPLSGRDQRIGTQMAQAARLALPGRDETSFVVKDEAILSDQSGALDRSLDRGQRIQLGPLRASHAARVSEIETTSAAPTLAFTSNNTVARRGMWVMGITPAQQVEQLVDTAQKRDSRSHFAAFLPDTPLGHALGDALMASCATRGLSSPKLVYHDDMGGDVGTQFSNLLQSVPRKSSGTASTKNVASSEPNAVDPLGAESASDSPKVSEVANSTVKADTFDALLLGDTGLTLQSEMDALAASQIDKSRLRILGPALWGSFSAKLSKLSGAWFAAPDPVFRRGFVAKFKARYGVAPSILADVAYDTAALAGAMLRQGQQIDTASLMRPTGFAGVDGVFALQPDGTVRRALAVFEIMPMGGVKMAYPASKRLDATQPSSGSSAKPSSA